MSSRSRPTRLRRRAVGKSVFSAAGAAGASLLLVAVAMSASAAPAIGRGRVDMVRSAASVPPLPSGSHVAGGLAPQTALSVDVVLRPRRPVELAAFADAVSTPSSPLFRHFLAPGRFAGTFGPTPSTIRAVRAWLTGSGLSLGPTSVDGLVVPVHGTAAQLGRAWGIGFARYRLPTGRVVRMPTSA
ncbi:MAG: protease pro-enzyme activation domain-containing protein, partial [Acidimicrobiales bacterium]